MDAGWAAVLAGWGGGVFGAVGALFAARASARSAMKSAETTLRTAEMSAQAAHVAANNAHAHEVEDLLREKRVAAINEFTREVTGVLARAEEIGTRPAASHFGVGVIPAPAEIEEVYGPWATGRRLSELAAVVALLADEGAALAAHEVATDGMKLATRCLFRVMTLAIETSGKAVPKEMAVTGEQLTHARADLAIKLATFERLARQLIHP
ncbi:hypothetical protein [Luteipulveratus mongoliensis]|uniref:Uncharacterized protein n=1 Tax=Luteipulveratus mongoliensis TaxID=571913 RepID=A0A0K1JIQ0_9MICO|nr:hypothetical protein [Luteipulveratus mongoliensis]AKU16592.1 hypothetical protein VV02_13190 [Luteipulveratus mongoliensis]